jgi:hypothetical protein
MPAAERPQLEEACATLRRVAKQVSTQTAALSHLIKHSIGVNQALVAGVFGTSAEPDVYGNRGSKKDLRHGAILNREL